MGGSNSHEEVKVNEPQTIKELGKQIRHANHILSSKFFMNNYNLVFNLENEQYLSGLEKFNMRKRKNEITIIVMKSGRSRNKYDAIYAEKLRRIDGDEFMVIYKKILLECLINAKMVVKSENKEVKNEKIVKKNGEKQEIPEETNLCPICMDKKVDVTLDCTHSFCIDCLKLWRDQPQYEKTCPLCREFNINDMEKTSYNFLSYTSQAEVVKELYKFILTYSSEGVKKSGFCSEKSECFN